MSKIKNWSREKEYENHEEDWGEGRSKKTIRAWQNDNTDSLAILHMSKDEEHDRAYSYTFEVDGDTKFWTEENQQKAIDRSTDWLEEHPYDNVEESGMDLRSKLLDVGREVEPDSKGVANNLSDDEIETIVATVNFFDHKGLATKQTHSDLTPPTSYRVFDWLGMMLDTDLDNERLEWMFDKMAKIYIQEKSVSGFIHQLRMRDLQVEMPNELRR